MMDENDNVDKYLCKNTYYILFDNKRCSLKK